MKTYMAQRAARFFQLSLLTGTWFLWAGFFMPAMLQAEPNISARYVRAHGTQLSIEIIAGWNPPVSAILLQRLPAGARIIASQPNVSNYNAKKNTAKWLLRNLRQGKTTVSITLDRAVMANEISAEIRFKPQQGEKMVTIQVRK